jgi:release factor glutamine methyltransferase
MDYLNNKFLIAFEIGYEQGEDVKKLAYKYLDNTVVSVEKDYSGKDRFVFIYSK